MIISKIYSFNIIISKYLDSSMLNGLNIPFFQSYKQFPMEQYKRSSRYSILRQLNHKKLHSFQITDQIQQLERDEHMLALLKSSKSSADLHNQPLLASSSSSPYFSQATSSHLKKSSVRPQDKQNKNIFLNKVYNYKISKLITSNTAHQKERYLRKLNQAIKDDAFVAISYEFDLTYIRFINDYLISSQITKIVLDNNPLGDAGVIKLASIFPQIKLKELSLVSVNMTNTGAAYLFNTLKDVPTLMKFNISTGETINKNKLSLEGAQHLKSLLNSPQCAIDTLHLNHLRLGSQGVRTAFEGVASSSLECLTLSKNQIGVKNISNLTQSLAKLPLMRLDLSKNSIQDAGIKSLTDILGLFYSKNSISMNLCYLNLSSNSITSQGFEYFCREMGINRTLETLILDENPLGQGDRFFNIKYYLNKNWGLKKLSLCNISPCQKDLKFICEGMEGNRSLEELNLSKNQIDGEMLSFIFFMLTRNKALRHIAMNNCKISDSYLLKNEYIVASNFSAIEEIYLESNYINIKGARVLKKIVTANQNILKLSLLRNCIPQTCIDQINETLKENQSKRPFEHQLYYFQSVSDLYEEKKRALKGEVEKMRKYEEKLQTKLLAEKIQYDLSVQETLKKKISNENYKIKLCQKSMPIKVVDMNEDIDEINFVTAVKSNK